MRLIEEPDVDVGVLYNRQTHQKDLSSLIQPLQDQARQHNIQVLLCSIDRLDLQTGTADGWLITPDLVIEQTLNIPPLLYNYALHSKPLSVDKMRSLRLSHSCLVVNPINRFHQLHVFDLLATCDSCSEAMPRHGELDLTRVAQDLQREGQLLVLPVKGLYNRRGVLIERVERPGGEDLAKVTAGSNVQHHPVHQLARVLGLMLKGIPSMSLQAGPLLFDQGAPLELRVYAQKRASGGWQVIETVRKEELFRRVLAPVSAFPKVREIVPSGGEDLKTVLERHVLSMCAYLDSFLTQVGSLTFDFLFTQEGKPMLAFVGGFEQNDWLAGLGTKEKWNEMIASTLEYGLFLRNRGEA